MMTFPQSLFSGQILGDDLISLESHSEYSYIEKQIEFYKNNPMPPVLLEQAFRKDALILPIDSDPLDVLSRRTKALFLFFSTMKKLPKWPSKKTNFTKFLTGSKIRTIKKSGEIYLMN